MKYVKDLHLLNWKVRLTCFSTRHGGRLCRRRDMLKSRQVFGPWLCRGASSATGPRARPRPSAPGRSPVSKLKPSLPSFTLSRGPGETTRPKSTQSHPWSVRIAYSPAHFSGGEPVQFRVETNDRRSFTTRGGTTGENRRVAQDAFLTKLCLCTIMCELDGGGRGRCCDINDC